MDLRRMTFGVVVMMLVLGHSEALHAQLNRGTIEGTVVDSQGGLVPGVEISITAVETNITAQSKTNSVGYYRVVDLVPGKYRAHFTVAGFAPLDITDIEVLPGQLIKIDAQVKLQASIERMEVKAEAPLLETAAANHSTTLDTTIVQGIPLAGRDLQQLVFLIPGVNNSGGPPGTNFGFNSEFGSFPDPTYLLGSAVSVNGGQAGANTWYLDGNLNVSGFGENIVVNPSPDATEEFQSITSGLSAEYGHTGGGVFSVVLKSGTNHLRGNLYEYLRNNATNARNPFTPFEERALRFNNFGGTVGGPVFLPHLYNGKNKTFFFFSWDASILHLIGKETFSVPTARMRVGDFSEDPSVLQNGIYNPYSSVGPDANGLFDRTAFGTPAPGNPYGANGCQASSVAAGAPAQTCNFATQIPSVISTPSGPRPGFDSVAMFFVNSFPLPNFNSPLSGCPMGKDGFLICDNYLGPVASSQDSSNISIKVDHQAGEKSKFFFEWLFSPGKSNNYRFPWTGPSFPWSTAGYNTHYPMRFRSQVFGLGHTYVFTPTLINEFRVNFSRQFLSTLSTPYSDSITGESQVVKALAPSRVPSNPGYPSPTFTVGPYGFGPQAWTNIATGAEAYNFLDNITRISGRHTWKTGFLYRLEHAIYDNLCPTQIGFAGGLAQNPVTGLGGTALAEFMMGAVPSNPGLSFAALCSTGYSRWSSWGAYVQDEFRVTSRLTLNLGLRYDVNGYFKDRRTPMSRFCFTCINPLTGLPGQNIYEGDPGFPKGAMLQPNRNGFGPRVSFAWNPLADRKTVVRGGYDVLYSSVLNNLNSPGQENLQGWGNSSSGWARSFYPSQCAPFSGQCVAWPLSDTTTDKALLLAQEPYYGPFPALSRKNILGIANAYVKPPHDPMVQRWTLELQHQFPGDLLVSLAYVGSLGTHLAGGVFSNYNYVHTKDVIKYKTHLNDQVNITDFFTGQAATQMGLLFADPATGTPATTIPRSVALLPFPFFFSGVTTSSTFEGTTTYHGMNARVQKRYSHGLDFVVAYTFSKKINNWAVGQAGSSVVDPVHWGRPGLIGGRSGAQGGGVSILTSALYQDPDNRNADRAIAPDDIPQMLNIAAIYELPFGQGKPLLNNNKFLSRLFGGWKLSSNFDAQSGIPLAITGPCDQVTCRPNLVGDPHFHGQRTQAQQIAQWINPAAFEPAFGSDQNFWANYDPNDPRAYQFGTAGIRLPFLRGPGFWGLDSALSKDFHLSESTYFQFRVEAMNVLNHMNPGLPNQSYCLPPKPDGSTDLVHQAGCQFGRITNVQTDPRSMQFALKFYW